jgi:hypothetical protein
MQEKLNIFKKLEKHPEKFKNLPRRPLQHLDPDLFFLHTCQQKSYLSGDAQNSTTITMPILTNDLHIQIKK